jgi:hypothetical protein
MAEDTRQDQNQPATTKPRFNDGRPGRDSAKPDQGDTGTAGKIGETKPASPGAGATETGDPKRRGLSEPHEPHQDKRDDAQNQRPVGDKPAAPTPH